MLVAEHMNSLEVETNPFNDSARDRLGTTALNLSALYLEMGRYWEVPKRLNSAFEQYAEIESHFSFPMPWVQKSLIAIYYNTSIYQYTVVEPKLAVEALLKARDLFDGLLGDSESMDSSADVLNSALKQMAMVLGTSPLRS